MPVAAIPKTFKSYEKIFQLGLIYISTVRQNNEEVVKEPFETMAPWG